MGKLAPVAVPAGPLQEILAQARPPRVFHLDLHASGPNRDVNDAFSRGNDEMMMR